MKTQNHISDQDLRQVILEQQTELPQQQIETHVSECEFCQSRLLNMAADDTWREEFSSSIQELPSLANEQLDTGEFPLEGQPPVGDEFDLLTVDQMLKEVLSPPRHPEMLGQLDRYDVESIIGCGGMGVVLRGFDRDLHRPIAIKMILPRLSRNGTAKQRFEREACAAAAVLHPNVIAIHGISKAAGVPWFVMPLIAGPSLGKIIQTNGPLPEREIVRIGKQIASGLAAAHSQGLVHRDIKPENILVDNQVNRVVITDFGLARRDSEESMTQTGMLAGTLNYMSPEQSRGEDVDARSDLFSLGSLLFYLATGVVPFKSDSAMKVLHKIGNAPHPNVQALNPEVSLTLAQLIDRLLEKDPSDRISTAVEIEKYLEEYLAHLNQPTKSPIPKSPKLRKPTGFTNHFVTKMVAAAATIAIVVASVWWILNGYGGTNTTNLANNKTDQPLTWQIVSERYDIDEPIEFEKELEQLGRGIERLSQVPDDDFGHPTFNPNHDLQNFSRNLETLKKAMDWPDHTSN